jgi:3-oxoadipate enol-lactonase
MTARQGCRGRDGDGPRVTPVDARSRDAAQRNLPMLPLGRRLDLTGRGTTFLREVPGPSGAPPVVLIHGWTASGGLNWLTAFGPLASRYRVVAPDLRGHGRGLRSRRRFRLADCADDVAALIEHLDLGPAIAVGYSMGGPVAQLLWKRHPDLVRGLVMCATSYRFVPGVRERLVFGTAMAAAAGTTRAGQVLARAPLAPIAQRLAGEGGARPESLRDWASAEMRRHDPRAVLEAGQAIAAYDASDWIREVDVPTSALVTVRDRAVPAMEQLKLAMAVPDTEVHRIDDGHLACARRSFGWTLRRAVDGVDARARRSVGRSSVRLAEPARSEAGIG